MENNKKNRICKCCGRNLPLNAFKLLGKLGYEHVCIDCKEAIKRNSLEQYNTQAILKELRRRGVKGKFTFTRTETIEL